MVSHIRSCGYSWACPQSRRFVGVQARSKPFFGMRRRRSRSREIFFSQAMPGKTGSFAKCCSRSRVSRRAVAWSKSKIFFFRPRPAFGKGPQVYPQKYVYRIVVIVNGGAHLWISMVLSTRSGVYVPHKPVDLPCMCLVEKMDKKSRCAKSRVFAHFVPVDIQKLIHSYRSLTIW